MGNIWTGNSTSTVWFLNQFTCLGPTCCLTNQENGKRRHPACRRTASGQQGRPPDGAGGARAGYETLTANLQAQVHMIRNHIVAMKKYIHSPQVTQKPHYIEQLLFFSIMKFTFLRYIIEYAFNLLFEITYRHRKPQQVGTGRI